MATTLYLPRLPRPPAQCLILPQTAHRSKSAAVNLKGTIECFFILLLTFFKKRGSRYYQEKMFFMLNRFNHLKLRDYVYIKDNVIVF